MTVETEAQTWAKQLEEERKTLRQIEDALAQKKATIAMLEGGIQFAQRVIGEQQEDKTSESETEEVKEEAPQT
jgi:hypothetical protein